MIKIKTEQDGFLRTILLTNLAAIGVLLVSWGVFVLSKADASGYLHQRAEHYFSDFSVIMRCALLDNPYDSEFRASYPPIAILILWLPARISKSIIHLGNAEILGEPLFWVSFSVFYAACMAACVPLISRLTGTRGRKLALYSAVFFLSGPLIFTLERGNVILAAFAFLLFYLAFYKSKNKAARELALIGLALAGTIKIYPLFFGILLLRERRWFCSARVFVYFVVLFFAPFLFFKGGFSNIRLFIENLGGFSTGNGLLGLRNMSTAGLVHKVFYGIERLFGTNLSLPANILGNAAMVTIAVLSIAAAYVSKNRFKVLLISALAVVLIPSISYYYSALFLAIPFFEFVRGFDAVSTLGESVSTRSKSVSILGESVSKHGGMEENRRTFYFLFFLVTASIILRALPVILGVIFTITLFYETITELRAFYQRTRAERGNRERERNS